MKHGRDPSPRREATHLPRATPQAAWRAPLAGVALLLLTAFAYRGVTKCGYVWDDDDHITANALLPRADGLAHIWLSPHELPQYYPLVHTTFWVEYQLWGLDPLGYHVVNVLLHSGAAILLWRLLRRLRVPGAWLAGALFAVHPVHVESVAWITERKNVLSTLLYLGAALAYLRFRLGGESPATTGPALAPDRRWYALAVLLFLMALLSKTVTCTLPAALMLVLWWKRGRLERGDVLPLIPLVPLGLAMGLATALLEVTHVHAGGAPWDLTGAQRMLVAGRAAWFYLAKLAWPADLSFVYTRWPVDAGSLVSWLWPVSLVALGFVLWKLRHRLGAGPLVALLFFVGTLTPALGFFNVYPMRFSFVADHFQYLASIGPIALFTAGLTIGLSRAAGGPEAVAGSRGRRLLFAVTTPGLVLALLATATARQTAHYRDLETLWRATVATNPGAWMAHKNLVEELLRQHRAEEALTHLLDVQRSQPDMPYLYHTLARVMGELGMGEQAGDVFVHALEQDPDDPIVHHLGLGLAFLREGKLPSAEQELRTFLADRPDYPHGHAVLAAVLARQNRPAEAEDHYREALRLAPGFLLPRVELAFLLVEEGRVDDAIAEYEAIVAMDPDNAEVIVELVSVLRQRGRLEEAWTWMQRSIAVDPAREMLWRALGADDLVRTTTGPRLVGDAALALEREAWNRAAAGDAAGAIEAYRASIEAHPHRAYLPAQLADVMLGLGRLDEAAALFRRAIYLSPGMAYAYNGLGLCLAQQGRHVAAVEHFAAAHRLEPAMLDAAYNLSTALAESGDFEGAAGALREAIALAAAAGNGSLAEQLGERLRAFEHELVVAHAR